MPEFEPSADMVRFSITSPTDLPEPQRAAYERIVAGRGKLPKPYGTLLASPKVTELVETLSRQLWEGTLPRLVLEAVFLSVARAQNCQYQWDNHEAKALEAGLTQESLSVLQAGGVPSQSASLASALSFVDEMQTLKRARDSTFDAVMAHFGAQGVSELCAFLGFATTIAFLLNAQQGDANAATRASS
jgi:AhpD family alkylhydroperoxidase